MAKKKRSNIQDIPSMKVNDGSDGPEMCTTDPRFRTGREWLGLMREAKRDCRKVKITYQESPETAPRTLVIAPYKLCNSVEGWAVEDLPPEGFKGPSYSLQHILAAELTDETFKDPYDDPAYVIAELLASRQ